MDDAERRAPLSGALDHYIRIDGDRIEAVFVYSAEQDRTITLAEMQALRATPPAVGQWLPIETAPKDVPVLIFDEIGNMTTARLLPYGWRLEVVDGHDRELIYDPTHWQSLPEAPQPREEDSSGSVAADPEHRLSGERMVTAGGDLSACSRSSDGSGTQPRGGDRRPGSHLAERHSGVRSMTQTIRERAVEAAMMALFEWEWEWTTHWDDQSDQDQADWRDRAKAAFDAIIVVLMEPDPEMMEAAGNVTAICETMEDEFRAEWQAMLRRAADMGE